MARSANLIYLDKQRVAITVMIHCLDPLHVPRGVSLTPVLLSTARPKDSAPLRKGAAQGLIIHPTNHQYLMGIELLDDSANKPIGVEFDSRGNIWI